MRASVTDTLSLSLSLFSLFDRGELRASKIGKYFFFSRVLKLKDIFGGFRSQIRFEGFLGVDTLKGDRWLVKA